MLKLILEIASILVSILLVILILMQVRGGGLGSLLGGDSGSSINRTRRGLEKTMYQVTIGLAVTFIAISIASFAFY